MALYDATIPQLSKMLRNMDRWLEKAAAFAAEKSTDPATLLTARLAPDQFALARQVQAACVQAVGLASMLSGKSAPKPPPGDSTIDELRAHIESTRTFLKSVTAADFEGADTRNVTLPFLPGKVMTGADYANEMGLPNFYFHVTTAYSILRHNGLGLGKADFVGRLTLRDP